MTDQSIDELRRISAELDRLNERLAAGGLEAADATELLEQITALATGADMPSPTPQPNHVS